MPRSTLDDYFPEPLELFDDRVKPIARKTSVRAAANAGAATRKNNIVCRVDLLRAAKAALRLTDKQISEMIGVHRLTVAAALRADPSTNLYTFCAIVQVLGLEMAEVFPYSATRKVVNARRLWSRGPYDNTPELLRLTAEERSERRRRKSKRFLSND